MKLKDKSGKYMGLCDKMRKRRLPTNSEKRAKILLSITCPVGTVRSWERYTIRKDGRIYFQGAWRGLNSVQALRQARRKKWNESKNDPKFREKQRQIKREYYYRNKAERNKANRDRYRSKPKWWRKKKNEQRVELARKTNPRGALRRAIADFRAGRIGLDELDRCVRDTINRTHAIGEDIDRKLRKADAISSASDECERELRKPDSKAAEAQDRHRQE